MKALCSALALVLLVAVPAQAQQLSLQITDGRVTLDAVNVPARQILAEWARVGGTKVVGAERITGTPLTLKLADMPERQALDIILRNVAGFMAAPRQASASPGASTYDRILIMATSSAPAPSTASRVPAPNFGPGMNGTQRRVPQRPPNLPPSLGDEPPMDDQQPDEPQDDQADTGGAQPVFTFPSPGAPGNNQVFVPMPNNTLGGTEPGAVTAPVITLQPGANGPTIYNFVPGENGQPVPQPAPQTPSFGIIGSPQPGMIQVPQPTQPGQVVRPPTRPPG
ncbi:MAG TPA: hypothetical protein VHH12_12015 [Mycobacterium sp.]|nr:hypothetical protein [Mycobacterium sp.]